MDIFIKTQQLHLFWNSKQIFIIEFVVCRLLFSGFSNVKIAQFKLEIKAIIGTWRPTEKKTNFGSSLLILKPFSLTAYFQRWQRHATLISAQKREKKNTENLMYSVFFTYLHSICFIRSSRTWKGTFYPLRWRNKSVLKVPSYLSVNY